MRSRALFLHWGPGGNCSVERLWFKDSLAIHWWDQPTQFQDPTRAINEILMAAEHELKSLSGAENRKVDLIAHSFGGQIAMKLAEQCPDLIRSLTLLACSNSTLGGFPNLAIRLSENLARENKHAEANHLRSLAQNAKHKLNAETFWPLVQGIIAVPEFMNLYWHKKDPAAKYASILAQGISTLNLDAFSQVVNCLLADSTIKNRSIQAHFPVHCLLGKHDPLQVIDEESALWRETFPDAVIKCVDTGHFIHFELDPSTWMPI